jgi:hypothetical protein
VVPPAAAFGPRAVASRVRSIDVLALVGGQDHGGRLGIEIEGTNGHVGGTRAVVDLRRGLGRAPHSALLNRSPLRARSNGVSSAAPGVGTPSPDDGGSSSITIIEP